MQPILKRRELTDTDAPRPMTLPDLASELAVALVGGREAAGSGSDSAGDPCAVAAKAARVVRIDGEARAIEITCSCGETTLVELEYGEPSPAPQSATAEDPS